MMKREADLNFSLSLQSIDLIEENIPYFKQIISNQNREELLLLDLSVQQQSSKSPKYKVSLCVF